MNRTKQLKSPTRVTQRAQARRQGKGSGAGYLLLRPYESGACDRIGVALLFAAMIAIPVYMVYGLMTKGLPP